MVESELDKRGFLRNAFLASLGLCIGTPTFAQDRRLFGIKVPQVVLNLLPAKPLNIAMTIDTVIQLEREADRRGLPGSILERNKGQPISATETSLYQLILPRLVALIDRSEQIDPEFADQAGGLLAELHATQHELPEGLLSLLPDALGLPMPQNRQLPVVGAAAQRLSLPDILPTPAADVARPDVDVSFSRAKDYATLKNEYGRLFKSASIRPEYAEDADWHLVMMRKSKARYASVSGDTAVPWYFIAVCHALESSFNFRAHLHNGDFPLSARTRQVPSGRPTKWLPPSDWESSARDALRLLGFAGQKDWTLERTLYRLEAYNGFGYRPHGVATPYLWSFSNHYARGKYVADRKWSGTAKSQQCGAAVMLRLLTDAGEVEWPTV